MTSYRNIVHSPLARYFSYSAEFSTVATETLIVGTPVVTTKVSGMREMLDDDNAYGNITDNNEHDLQIL